MYCVKLHLLVVPYICNGDIVKKNAFNVAKLKQLLLMNAFQPHSFCYIGRFPLPCTYSVLVTEYTTYLFVGWNLC